LARTLIHRHPETLAELLKQLGGIDPARVRLKPPPGLARERDLIRLLDRKQGLYELVDGVLVEKAYGPLGSALGVVISCRLWDFVEAADLGIILGANGAVRLRRGLVRLPALSFFSWDRLPVQGEIPDIPIATWTPDLIVEIPRPGNTPKEMGLKLNEYFEAGVRLVWYVDPKKRTVTVYTSPEESRVLTEKHSLDGGEVLPGFTLPVKKIFARMRRKPS
jgi:Uma2 family endonuclease